MKCQKCFQSAGSLAPEISVCPTCMRIVLPVFRASVAMMASEKGVLNTLISPPINTSPRPKTFWRSFVGYPGWTRCFEFQNPDEIRYLSKTFDPSYSTSIDLFDLKSFTWESSFLQEFLVAKHQQHCAKILLNTNIQGHKLIYLNRQTNRCTYR